MNAAPERIAEIKHNALSRERYTMTISTDELEACNLAFFKEDIVISSTEAFEYIDQEKQPLRLDLSAIGLSDEYNWFKHHDVQRQFNLISDIISDCKKEPCPINHIIWIDCNEDS
ncbi:hypothetical protein [Halocynthiibacter styelae]|uniref:Uncharacterized protein n=1 Tax=Halocynthiibacter styelae TaxID=2761955 RepID=A0A8J7IEJ1_9RHOB|nr:hypothetical protein [Paenihalocynthiibacter styelae]MBI1493677.1 hypothetical protein [Paenihalocynthiibacter styelae]